MDSLRSLIDIIFIVSCIALTFSMVWCSMRLYKYYSLKQQSLQNDIEYRQIENENKNKTVEYSNKVLELVRSIVGQIAVLKFRTFQDSHDMSKITTTNTKALVDDVAMMAKRSLNMNNIFLDDTFFTKEFIENYIIETSIILIKQMVEKAANDDIE